MNNYIYKVFNTEIKTLTPIHIGTGNLLSPSSSILEINQHNLEIKDKSHVSKVDPKEIQEFLNTNGLPFISGSSLKGAIRTTILFECLTTKQGKEQLILWLNELIDIISNNNINKNLKNKFIEKGGEINNKKYKGYNKLVEEFCLGNSNSFNAWNNLAVFDSDIIDNNTKVYELRRFYLNSDKDGIPTFVEALPERISTKMNIKYSMCIQNENIVGNKLNKFFDNWENLKKIVNAFSLKLVEYELKVLQYDDVDRKNFINLENFLKEIKSKINENKHIYLRIGAGKMQFYQTIALAIYHLNINDDEWLDKAWENYFIYIRGFKEFIEKEFDVYPKTRALTYDEKLPLGWVEISLIN